jgi:hypothetical protein
MKRRNMCFAPRGTREGSDAVLHLPRRLVRESDRQDGSRGDSLLDEPRDAMCDDTRLARPGPREYECRTVRQNDSLSLRRIESGQVEHGRASCHARGSASSP